MKPTFRQTRFVEEYLVTGNGAQAARRAGYSERCAKEQAHRLLTYVHVRAAIDRKRAETARITGPRVDGVIQGLLDAVDVAKLSGDADAQIAAWREIAKILGMYPETTKSRCKANIDSSDIRTWLEEMLMGFRD